MQIILVRHGEAERQTTTDAMRRLTAHGQAQAQQSAAWLLNHGYQLDGLFASPYVRAQQTAGVIAEVLDLTIETCPLITPDDEPQPVIAWLDSLDLPEHAVIALVCHMPIVGRLASLLCEGVANQGYHFSLAETWVIETPICAVGQGQKKAGFVPTA